MENEKTTLNELSGSMEKMYHEHNAQMVNLSKMIVVLARISGKTPQEFAQEINNEEANKKFANEYNTILDTLKNSSEE